MLHVLHLLEPRFGVQRGARIRMRLLLASGLMLMTGLGLLLMPGHAFAQVSSETAKAIATRLLDHLDRGEYAQAEAMFDARMKQAVPAARLEQVWKSLPAAGSRGEPSLRPQGEMQILQVPLTRGDAELNASISIDAQGRVSGLLVRPAPPAPPAPPVATATFVEKDVMVGAGPRALPATLAMPKGEGPFPAVVLVHGSGPQDRDETIGANRPFLDIARGLADQGVAVLRYDKRSEIRPQDYADGRIDIDSETTDDAVTALATLRAQPGIDPKRVFVLGHSQGAMMAPRIAIKDGNQVAGLILLAAPARNLLDILLEQNVRLLAMQGASESPAGIAHLDKLKAQIANVRGKGDAAVGAPMGLPVAYWRSIDAVDPLAEARKAGEPMLILHGGRDIQVVDADWQAWQAAFGNNKAVTMKRYPELNHLAIATEAGAGLESYEKPGRVDETLIADIARWIKAAR